MFEACDTSDCSKGIHGYPVTVVRIELLDFKFLPCSESCICSFGYWPGVRLCFSDVSEPSARSIFKGSMWSILDIKPLTMDLTEGSETSAKHNLTQGKYPKKHIQDRAYFPWKPDEIWVTIDLPDGTTDMNIGYGVVPSHGKVSIDVPDIGDCRVTFIKCWKTGSRELKDRPRKILQ
jgi:hypothetical protein